LETPVLPLPDIPGLSAELWAQTPIPVQAIILAFIERDREREENYKKLEQRLHSLEARIKQDSSNSSKPPSSDPWWKKEHKKKEKSGKKPGGQPGHSGRHRPIVSLEEVDEIVQHFPEQCDHCGDALSAEGNLVDEPDRHQVFELPIAKIMVIEHRLHRRTCESCGTISKAKAPPGIFESVFGPRMQAEIVHLVANCKLPRRSMVRYAAESWGVNISLGSIHAIEQKASSALEGAYGEALLAVQRAPVRYIDETSWPQNNRSGWLWTVTCNLATVFLIAPTRGSAEIKALLGDALLCGHIVTDRYKGYYFVEMIKRGICHAHLKRDFAKIAMLGGPTSTLGHALGALHQHVFAVWHRFKSGEIERDFFDVQLKALQKSIRDLLEQGIRSARKKIAGMCTDILRHWEAMWSFTRIAGMEPTNNAAERAHRQAVKWRKVCFGTRSAGGSRFVERMLTVAETCRQNGRNVLDYLTQSIAMAATGQAAPRLLPLSSEA
jgi:transposase